VQCKKFENVKDNTQQGIVANALLQVHDIPNMNVMLHPYGEDISFVASTNDLGKVWIVHTLASKWPQCDNLLATQGVLCKHVMKVFKMFHPRVKT
jgi:hypothetical protein